MLGERWLTMGVVMISLHCTGGGCIRVCKPECASPTEVEEPRVGVIAVCHAGGLSICEDDAASTTMRTPSESGRGSDQPESDRASSRAADSASSA